MNREQEGTRRVLEASEGYHEGVHSVNIQLFLPWPGHKVPKGKDDQLPQPTRLDLGGHAPGHIINEGWKTSPCIAMTPALIRYKCGRAYDACRHIKELFHLGKRLLGCFWKPLSWTSVLITTVHTGSSDADPASAHWVHVRFLTRVPQQLMGCPTHVTTS